MNKTQENINDSEQKLTEKDIIDYVIDRFTEVKKSNKIKDLVSFQAMNKHMIMAHNQNELKILGNIVASNKKIKFSEILEEYEKHLKIALGTEVTTKTHSNVILHIFGFFSKNFSQQEKEIFFGLLTNFKDGKISIGEVLSEINPVIYRFNNTYLASQTYFLLYSNQQPGNLFKLLSK
ncbi:MAG: YbgA family protein [Nitrosopumilus sp.]|nr:YbgA family protein [Nitrosopumilus sp.]